MNQFDVIIIGGGIVGATTACGCRSTAEPCSTGGGDWQQEGCVNEAPCGDNTLLAPLEISDQLVMGSNRIAARVSNPFMGSAFELSVHCR